MTQHIGEIAILVSSCEEAIAWFTHKLGFVQKEDIPIAGGERWVTVGPAGGQAMLRLARAETPEQAAQVGRQAKGRVLLYLHTDDFARDHGKYLASGVHFIEAPRHEPYGMVAVFEDLYGNHWDLIQRKA